MAFTLKRWKTVNIAKKKHANGTFLTELNFQDKCLKTKKNLTLKTIPRTGFFRFFESKILRLIFKHD